MPKWIKRTLVTALITYLLIELVSFIAIKTIYTQAKLPQFFTDPKDTAIFPFTYADLNTKWGIWHFNKPVKVPYGCLTLECTPNSVGARDREREKISIDSNRFVVLGDSFMEGFGIPVEKRISNIFEKETGREMLNFACPDMGSTQEYLVYKDLASKFSHYSVMMGILPANDFLNDNVKFDSTQRPLRYKPYWKGTYPNMQLTYVTDSLTKSEFTPQAYKKYKSTVQYKGRHILENITCWFNIVYYIVRHKEAVEFVQKKTKGNKGYSGYYDFTEDDFSRLKQSLSGIKQIAKDKTVIIFTIPIRNDFLRYKEQKSIPPLVSDLNNYCGANEITYIDLLTTCTKSDLEQYDKLFFDCDIHWNETGNLWAYNLLRRQIDAGK